MNGVVKHEQRMTQQTEKAGNLANDKAASLRRDDDRARDRHFWRRHAL